MENKNIPFKLNRDLSFLLTATVIMHLASFLVIPILPIILRTDKALNPAHIGIVIGAFSLAFQVGSIISAILADRIGSRYTMLIGTLIQSISILGFAFTGAYGLLTLLSAGNGLGNGMNSPTVKAAISTASGNVLQHRTTAFSYRGIAANVGIGIAGIALIFIANKQYNYIFYVSAIIFLILAVLMFFFMRDDCHIKQCKGSKWSDYKEIARNKAFMLFSVIIIFVSYAFALLQFLLPLRASSVLTNESVIGSVWTIISIEVILLQTFTSNRILTKYHPLTSIIWSMLFFAGGIYLIGISNTFILLVLSAVIFTIGQMLMMPISDSVIGKLANAEIIGAYFSIANILTGLGTAIGAYSAGLIINTYGINTTIIPWAIISVSILVLTFIIYVIKRLKVI